MKKLLSGNEAIALGAIRAGASVFAGYPGFPASEIVRTVFREAAVPGSRAAGVYVEWSANETAALEVAAGAAISGARAMVAMNQAGLNAACASLMSLNYLGFSGGLVAVVADDPGAISSRTEQDSRHFARYAKLAVFDPSGPEEACLMAADAFDYSEKYGRPALLRTTALVCRSCASVNLNALPEKPFKTPSGFDASAGRRLFVPGRAAEAHEKIEADLAKMGDDFSSYRGNSLIVAPHDAGPRQGDALPGSAGFLGIAAGGASYAYAMEALGPLPPKLRMLKVGTFPFPEALALNFLEGLDEVLVLEELDPVIEDELLRLCGGKHLRVEILGKRSGYMPRSGEYSPTIAAEKIETFLRKVWVSISDLETTLAAGDAAEPEFSSLASLSPGVLAAAGVPALLSETPLPPETPPLPDRAPELCAGCPRRGIFFAIREAVRKYSPSGKAAFCGDLGSCAQRDVPLLDMTDAGLCMGSGIAVAQGIGSVDKGLNFAFIGNSAFFHSGIPGLANAAYNRADLIVVALDDGAAGNEPYPGTSANALGKTAEKLDIPALAAVLGIKKTVRLSPFDLETAETAIGRLIGETGVRLAIFEGPCAFQKKGTGRCAVDSQKCSGCGLCVEQLGCPALSNGRLRPEREQGGEGGRFPAAIDAELCAGCGLCKGLCPFNAIEDESSRGPS